MAATCTFIAALFIAWQASKVAKSQKEIAGLAEVNKLVDKLETTRYQAIRKQVGTNYLAGTIDELYAQETLNFIEDLAAYAVRGYIPTKVVDDLLGYGVICWWYAAESIVEPRRIALKDPNAWRNSEKLVKKLHRHSKRNKAKAWAKCPSDELMRDYFREVVEAATWRETAGL